VEGKASIHYVHTDHLGTPQEITDANGKISWSADYSAWGEQQHSLILNAEEEAETRTDCAIQFQGQYFDVETGLQHYNRFRYYDPETGRFISRDPIKYKGGLNNLHQYVPNPIAWIDPWGLHDILADSDLVCRGGTCTKIQFETGSGVTKGEGGVLSGISTQAKPNASLETLATPYKNRQVGVATVADIEAAGGKIILDGKLNSANGTHVANHATVDGLTAEQAEKIFNPTKENPVQKEKRGDICGLR
jgi:RHS repeat-associated protein